MNRYVALLRGINLGRNKRIAMADLRSLVADLGHAEVSTLIVSGNVRFQTARSDEEAMAAEMEAAIRVRLGLEVRVFVRRREELAALVAANPLPAAAAEPSRFHVAFLSADPAPARWGAVVAVAPRDELRLGRRAVYIWYRGGVLESNLSNIALEKVLGVASTMRNWNTVNRLAGE